MERLTIPDEPIEGGMRRAIIDMRAVKAEAMKIYWSLKKYEDTGLTPEEIMAGKMLTGWIPVEERLPEEPETGLIEMEDLQVNTHLEKARLGRCNLVLSRFCTRFARCIIRLPFFFGWCRWMTLQGCRWLFVLSSSRLHLSGLRTGCGCIRGAAVAAGLCSFKN